MIDPESESAVRACADLVGRTGATKFEIGFLHDDVPSEEAGWYAHAQYRGARILVEDCRSPGDAATKLTHRILEGAKCRCGKLVALSPFGATAFYSGRTVDGQSWNYKDAESAGQCLWQLVGERWEPSCPEPEDRR
jgi:hypothetical protein